MNTIQPTSKERSQIPSQIRNLLETSIVSLQVEENYNRPMEGIYNQSMVF